MTCEQDMDLSVSDEAASSADEGCLDVFRDDVPGWYAVYVQVNHEKKVEQQLVQKTIDCFLPLMEKWSRRRDRRKRIKVPLFPGYMFVHARLSNPVQVEILKVPGAVYILKNELGPVPIPPWQVQSLKKLLEHADKLQPHEYLKKGDLVQVIRGPFEGCTGVLQRHKPNKGRLVISIDVIKQAVSVELNVEDVEPVKKRTPIIQV